MAQLINNLPAMWETQVQSPGQGDSQRRKQQPVPVCLPGEFHGQRSLADYSQWGCKELDITERSILPLSTLAN